MACDLHGYDDRWLLYLSTGDGATCMGLSSDHRAAPVLGGDHVMRGRRGSHRQATPPGGPHGPCSRHRNQRDQPVDTTGKPTADGGRHRERLTRPPERRDNRPGPSTDTRGRGRRPHLGPRWSDTDYPTGGIHQVPNQLMPPGTTIPFSFTHPRVVLPWGRRIGYHAPGSGG